MEVYKRAAKGGNARQETKATSECQNQKGGRRQNENDTDPTIGTACSFARHGHARAPSEGLENELMLSHEQNTSNKDERSRIRRRKRNRKSSAPRNYALDQEFGVQ
jgi:hypothetical protein